MGGMNREVEPQSEVEAKIGLYRYEIDSGEFCGKKIIVFPPGTKMTTEEFDCLSKQGDRVVVIGMVGRGYVAFNAADHDEARKALEAFGLYPEADGRICLVTDKETGVVDRFSALGYNLSVERQVQDVLEMIPAERVFQNPTISSASGTKIVGIGLLNKIIHKFELPKYRNVAAKKPVGDDMIEITLRATNFPNELKRKFGAVKRKKKD